MATYNGAQYIKEQIDSILAQTIQDFELVVCDDCSTDDTWRILEDYSEKDERIRIFCNETNQGFMKNFEKAISLTQYEFVALSDQDDIWSPDHLEILLEQMCGNIQIVCGRPIFVDENNCVLPKKYDYFKMDYIPRSNEAVARHIILGRSTYQGASMLIRRTFFDVALPIPQGALYHDSWFAILACFMGGICYIDKPIMRYRRLQNSVTYKEMRVSAFRYFFRHILHGYVLRDRLSLIQAIKDRIISLDPKQKELLCIFEKILKRKHSVIGRIASVPYRLYYFKSIYACDITHLFI